MASSSEPTRPDQRLPLRWRLLSVIAVLSVGFLVAFLLLAEGASLPEQLTMARRAFERGQSADAEAVARRILDRNPKNSEARWIAARSCADQQLFRQAVEDLKQIPFDDPLALDARLLSAELLHRELTLFAQAEIAYREALDLDPLNPEASDGLARLLAVCGRRSEAVPLILQLVKQEQASDLLLVLARDSGAISDEELLKRAHQANPSDPAPLLGLARLADLQQHTAAAITLCREAVESAPEFVPAHVELGRYLLLQNDFQALTAWRQNLPAEALSSAEIQKIIGLVELHDGRPDAALDAFFTAVQSAPDSREVCYQISQLLFTAGDSDAASVFVEQVDNNRRLQEAQDRVLFLAQQPDENSLTEMITAYERCGRLLEAYGWAQMAAARYPQNPTIRDLKVRLATETRNLPPEIIPQRANPAIDLTKKRYVFPKSAVVIAEAPPDSELKSSLDSEIRFTDDPDNTGLSFVFENGGTLKSRMFEFNGGGVGSEDLDRDGYPEIVFSQGGVWEARGTPENSSDAMFRNIRGQRFEDVSRIASFGGTVYGQGVAIGDIDQDGFPDILVAGIGCSRLWKNCGDGTFQTEPDCLVSEDSSDPWMTSCTIADLNQDSLPDLLLTGYLSGSDVFDRVCRNSKGAPEACLPTVFHAARDVLLLNEGDGSFRNTSDRLPMSTADGKGLGIVVFDPVGNGHPWIYLANDTTPNTFAAIDPSTGLWNDTAFAAGLAVSGLGKSEGSMGIALGDPDHDGIQDLVVTNFLYESFAWYQGLSSTLYRDDRLPAGLQEATSPVLGFGTQFLDADLDGQLELFIANGHVDDLSAHGKPWKMPAQLFTFRGGKFHQLPADNLGDWFQRNHLGRAVSRCDWNVDGLPDLVVGNLLEPSVLLTNTSRNCGRSLRLRLVSVNSNRESVCATVICRIDDLTQTWQITAGDGYQCNNEKIVIFGCGSASTVDELRIHWPNGHQQVFSSLKVPSDEIIVEDRPVMFPFPR